MTTVLPFSNNAIGVFAYEGFSYTISNPDPTYTLQTVTNSSGFGPSPSSLYFTKNGNTSYTFAISDLSTILTPGTTENFVLQTVSGSSILTSSNMVTIGPGRFLDGSGASLNNNSYTFYKNEAIPKIRLVAPSFALKPVTSVPTLPPGLSFVSNASNIYDISGIPLVTVPNSNYQIIGVQNGGSKIVTTRFNLAISNERIQLNLSGSPIISGMTIDTPITPRVITLVPPVGSTTVRYTFPTLPDGILVYDGLGNVQSSPYTTSSVPYTFVISGTPTSNAAYGFRSANIGSNGSVYTVQASRIVPTPLVDTTQSLTFSFGETVLFDQSTIPVLYTNIPVDSSANFFRAATYFTSNVDISDISSSSLPTGLTLVFDGSRAKLTGTPTVAGSANYTIRAINSNGVTRDYVTPITISNDAVTFSSPVGTDLCYSFILSRPVDLEKTGYYTSNIRFTATAASGRAITLSAPALTGTGLSLNTNGVITGLPTAVTPLTDLVVTATAVGTSVTATKTIKFSILDDVFTFADISTSSLSFIQNRAITPFQVQVSTLSGRNVIDFSQTGLPSGLVINPAGLVYGTPLGDTSGNVEFNATTGFSSGTRDFSFNVIPDTVIFRVPQGTYTYTAGDPVGSIDIDAVSYSGLTVSNFDLSLSPTYGLTVESSTGILSGTWTSGVPPDTLIPSSCNFTINAQAGGARPSLSTTFTASPVLDRKMLFNIFTKDVDAYDVQYTSTLFTTQPSNITNFQKIPGGRIGTGVPEITIKSTADNDFSTNVIVAAVSGGGSEAFGPQFVPDGGVLRASNAIANFTDISFNRIDETNLTVVSSVTNITGTTKWRAGGRRGSFDNGAAVVIPSSDNGVTWEVSNASIVANEIGEIVRTRDDGFNSDAYSLNPYLQGGLALKYSSDNSGILIAGGLEFGGGPVMLRSTDEGERWNNVSGGFLKECSALSLDSSSIWIATGSDAYRTADQVGGVSFFSGATNTIKYSTDSGATWDVATGGFNMYAYDVVYGNASWLATGVQATTSGPMTYFAPELRFSTNGSNWTKIDLSTSDLFPTNDFSILSVMPPLRIGSMGFDGNYWNVFVNAALQGGIVGSYPTLYRHDASSSLLSGWVGVDIASAVYSNLNYNATTRFLALTPPTLLYTGDPPININLTFNIASGTGPVLTSPTTRSFLNYQYIPITPIQLTATGTGIVYFFVEAADLPAGLTFNPLTNQITGTSVQIGEESVQIILKDNLGTSVYALSFTTVIPRVVRKQDGAGAYTSLLRQYTEVLGAQGARDSRALPSQERRLGEFMSPEAPDVVTQTVDPKCYSSSNCT
jgi:hypothetical protein